MRNKGNCSKIVAVFGVILSGIGMNGDHSQFCGHVLVFPAFLAKGFDGWGIQVMSGVLRNSLSQAGDLGICSQGVGGGQEGCRFFGIFLVFINTLPTSNSLCLAPEKWKRTKSFSIFFFLVQDGEVGKCKRTHLFLHSPAHRLALSFLSAGHSESGFASL